MHCMVSVIWASICVMCLFGWISPSWRRVAHVFDAHGFEGIISFARQHGRRGKVLSAWGLAALH